MTQKYFIGKCGGENCQFRSRDVLIQSVVYFCRVDYKDCDIEHCKNCPHGITIPEAADKMLRFSLLGRDFDYADLSAQRQQREEELEHLLEVQNGKKQN